MALAKTYALLGISIALISTISCENVKGSSKHETSDGLKQKSSLSGLAGGNSRGNGNLRESDSLTQGHESIRSSSSGTQETSDGIRGSYIPSELGAEVPNRSSGHVSDSSASGSTHISTTGEIGSSSNSNTANNIRSSSSGSYGKQRESIAERSSSSSGNLGDSENHERSSANSNLGSRGTDKTSSIRSTNGKTDVAASSSNQRISGSETRGNHEQNFGHSGNDRRRSQSNLKGPGSDLTDSRGIHETSRSAVGVNRDTKFKKYRQ